MSKPETVEEPVLTPEEQQMVDAFAQQIDLNDSTAILQYGAGTQKKMADFSETALEKVKTKDLGEVGDCALERGLRTARGHRTGEGGAGGAHHAARAHEEHGARGRGRGILCAAV